MTIPYARDLARTIPPIALRLRRDFRAILSLIEAHAILHQRCRARDSKGRIVATLDDYEVVSELVRDLIAEGVEASVPTALRETIVAVAAETEKTENTVTITAVAKRLGIDKSAALRRVKVCLNRGYIINREPAKGKPANLVLGEPLPEERQILPLADDPRPNGCTVDCDFKEGPPTQPQPTTGIATEA